MSEWKTRRRSFTADEFPLVMGILNVTPDSFSDGGKFSKVESALARAEEMMYEGVDIIDVGGESTRPGAAPVSAREEIERVLPIVERLIRNYPHVVSVDTTKSEVARRVLDAGADIINDISGLRFDARVGREAARAGAGLVLMHSRGTATTLHEQPLVGDVFAEVTNGLRESIAEAIRQGVRPESIVIDPGVGFGKTAEQNLELLARTNELVAEFAQFRLLVGTSRKRFIGWLLDDAPIDERLHGTMATIAAAVLGGAQIVRVHDVREGVETARVAAAIRRAVKKTVD